MNQQNRELFSRKNNQQFNSKSNSKFKKENWFKLINRNKFGYLTATVMSLTLFAQIFSPAKLALSQSTVYDSLEKQTNETFILAQEERESEGESAERERESEGESAERERESEGESAERERESEGESAERERESEGESAERERESEGESAERERESEGESAEGEGESEEALSFEEEKEALEENIDEHYEEWKSNKTSVQISHSFSAITTIVLTIVITLVGTGLFVIPSGRLIILILGLITVLIQLNSNIFLLQKSLAGYTIVEEQSSFLKEKLETVETEKELEEIKELFRELSLEALSLE